MGSSKSYRTGFPVFALCSAGKNGEFLVGGGGGGTKAGVRNAVADAFTLELEEISDFKFSNEDDGCMSLAAHPLKKAFIAGVNSSGDLIRMGDNQNARVFHIQNKCIQFISEYSFQTTSSTDPEHYQKVGRFNKEGKIFAAGTTDGYLSFWSFPEMTVALPSQHFENSEILDLHMDSANIVVVTPKKLRILDLKKTKITWAIENVTCKSVSCNFRSARFGAGGILYVVLNSTNKKQAYIQKYDTKTWDLMKTKQVSAKPITAFSMSENGGLIAFGSSDMTVSVLDSKSLSAVVKVKKAHTFPVTAIDFNYDATAVLSGSADGSVVLTAIPEPGEPFGIFKWLLFFICLAFLALALFSADVSEL